MFDVLHLEGDNLEIKGATKVVSSTQAQAVVEAGEKSFVITGSALEVKKLNLEEGEVVFTGNVSLIKIGRVQDKKQPLLKRLFK
ncbi:MAG: hypothetical protein IJY90_03115 [Clostridia bacterium]|nr:hypothetical protein [Clostridia bacterium]